METPGVLCSLQLFDVQSTLAHLNDTVTCLSECEIVCRNNDSCAG